RRAARPALAVALPSAAQRLRFGDLDRCSGMREESGELLERGAGEDRHPSPGAALRILGGEHRGGVVEEPAGPEAVALLRAGRVVEELVDEVVDSLRHGRQAGERSAEVLGGRGQVLQEGDCGGDEGTQAVADDRSRLADQGAKLIEGRRELAEGGGEPARGRT